MVSIHNFGDHHIVLGSTVIHQQSNSAVDFAAPPPTLVLTLACVSIHVISVLRLCPAVRVVPSPLFSPKTSFYPSPSSSFLGNPNVGDPFPSSIPPRYAARWVRLSQYPGYPDTAGTKNYPMVCTGSIPHTISFALFSFIWVRAVGSRKVEARSRDQSDRSKPQMVK